MRKAESIENIKTAKRILDALGIPFSLFLGTALGAWRDGDFCPGDEDDVDLAVHVAHYAQADAIKHAFIDAGFSMHEYTHADAISPEIAFEKKHDGWHTKVDIFFLTPRADKMVWTFYTADGVQNRAVASKYFLNFTHAPLFGELFNIPDLAADYLAANYGPNWETPIHRNNWQWDKDNQCPTI